MHWADYTAKILKERGGPQVSASGITPSGEFHIGHLREILSAEMIHRACLDAGIESEYVFIVDSMDPLRRVYDFLSPSYEQFIGHPLHIFQPPMITETQVQESELCRAFPKPFFAGIGKNRRQTQGGDESRNIRVWSFCQRHRHGDNE